MSKVIEFFNGIPDWMKSYSYGAGLWTIVLVILFLLAPGMPSNNDFAPSNVKVFIIAGVLAFVAPYLIVFGSTWFGTKKNKVVEAVYKVISAIWSNIFHFMIVSLVVAASFAAVNIDQNYSPSWWYFLIGFAILMLSIGVAISVPFEFEGEHRGVETHATVVLLSLFLTTGATITLFSRFANLF